MHFTILVHTYNAYVHFMAAILVAYGYRLFERSLFSYSLKSITSTEIKLQNTTIIIQSCEPDSFFFLRGCFSRPT